MNMPDMKCKICGSPSPFLFTKIILLKYEVSYFKCKNCGFIQTEKPYWLEETYQSSSYAIDTGLVVRPLMFGQVTEKLIMQYFDPFARFVDYGGGNGLLVRLMRDKGFDFYRHDKYADNIYALCFDLTDLPREKRAFELLTSFEVLEHFDNPEEELNAIFSLSKNVLCSTFIQPLDESDLPNWWYFADLHGQHISFYTEKTLKIIAEKFGCYFYSNGVDLHLFTPKKIKHFLFYSSYSGSPSHKIQFLYRKGIDRLYKTLRGGHAPSHPRSRTLQDADWVKEQFMRGNISK